MKACSVAESEGCAEGAARTSAFGWGDGLFTAALARKDEGSRNCFLLFFGAQDFRDGGSLAWGRMDLSQIEGGLLSAGLLPMVGKMPTSFPRCAVARGPGATAVRDLETQRALGRHHLSHSMCVCVCVCAREK